MTSSTGGQNRCGSRRIDRETTIASRADHHGRHSLLFFFCRPSHCAGDTVWQAGQEICEHIPMVSPAHPTVSAAPLSRLQPIRQPNVNPPAADCFMVHAILGIRPPAESGGARPGLPGSHGPVRHPYDAGIRLRNDECPRCGRSASNRLPWSSQTNSRLTNRRDLQSPWNPGSTQTEGSAMSQKVEAKPKGQCVFR